MASHCISGSIVDPLNFKSLVSVTPLVSPDLPVPSRTCRGIGFQWTGNTSYSVTGGVIVMIHKIIGNVECNEIHYKNDN